MSKDLIALAESLDAVRIAANANDLTAPQSGVYGYVAQALTDTLGIILGDGEAGQVAYDAILDGCTVREALAVAR